MNLRRLEDTDLKQQFVILSLLLRELKKGETFASLLNIQGGDIHVVLTHLVRHDIYIYDINVFSDMTTTFMTSVFFT